MILVPLAKAKHRLSQRNKPIKKLASGTLGNFFERRMY